MQSKGSIKILLLMGLLWVTVSCLISCAPAKFTRTDIDNLQISARNGDAKSQVLIGEVYEFGADVGADPRIAGEWYQLSANQDNPEAQFYLGVMYERGAGVKRNMAESLKWLFRSAEQGYEKSQIMLAALYLQDKGLDPEFMKYLKRYRQSAEKGNPLAQYILGWIYREGIGLPINAQEAVNWYQKAARQGNAMAQFALGNIYLEGNLAPANLPEALQWYQKSAETERPAQVKLYELYKGTGGVQENKEEAEKWLKRLTQNADAPIPPYIKTQYTILNTEKERNPARALRACNRLRTAWPAEKETSDTCRALQKQIGEKTEARFQEARSALQQKDWNKFRNRLSDMLIADFDESRLRGLTAAAWRLIEEETRSREKTAQEILRQMEAAERAPYRKKNVPQISKMINTFKSIVNQALQDNPGDAALLALAQKGRKVIISLQEKMKPPRLQKEKIEEKATDFPEEIPDDHDPGEEEYRKAQTLFNGGHYGEALQHFEKTTKIRGSKYIASAYIYLGVSHLARINPARITEARKLRLKGLACFQNALRFDGGVVLPAGYDKYQPVFEEAKGRLQ